MTDDKELPPGAEYLPTVLTVEGGVVMMRFAKPVCHLCLSPMNAVDMAASLVHFAGKAQEYREHAEAEAQSVTEALLKKAGFTPAKP